MLADLNVVGAEESAAKLRSSGHEALAIAADTSRPQQAGRMVSETLASYGRIDILVNNAGINRGSEHPDGGCTAW